MKIEVKDEKPDKQTPPPQPPSEDGFGRRVTLRPQQVLGVGLLMLMPLLALLGVFGPARGTSEATGDGLALSVVFPTRLRLLMIDSAQVTVRNLSEQTLGEVTVVFEHRYLEAFGEVALNPAPENATADGLEVTFDEVLPGETRLVHLSFRAQDPFVHSGQVSAWAEGAGEARVTLRTIVFP